MKLRKEKTCPERVIIDLYIISLKPKHKVMNMKIQTSQEEKNRTYYENQ